MLKAALNISKNISVIQDALEIPDVIRSAQVAALLETIHVLGKVICH